MERRDVVGLQAARTAAIDAPPAVALEGGPADPTPEGTVQRREKRLPRRVNPKGSEWSETDGAGNFPCTCSHHTSRHSMGSSVCSCVQRGHERGGIQLRQRGHERGGIQLRVVFDFANAGMRGVTLNSGGSGSSSVGLPRFGGRLRVVVFVISPNPGGEELPLRCRRSGRESDWAMDAQHS